MRSLETEAVGRLAAAGAFFSRPYGAALETAFEINQLNTALLKKIKGIFDPKQVLNPGRFRI